MKKLEYILYFTVILLSSCKSVDPVVVNPDAAPYIGTWHSQNGNQLFIVNIWEERNNCYGHYKMVEFNNGVIGNIIYDSNRKYENGAQLPSVISASASSEYGLAGSIYDNTIPGYNDLKRGDLQIKILSETPECSTCPVNASWKVNERMRDLIVEEEPPFSIPVDIVLTKIN